MNDAGITAALAGNPNVGKSTVFNALTGMRQHTGNWIGKTVGTARGVVRTKGGTFTLFDIPGSYSLKARSEEERVARDFICFGSADVTVVLCDASCIERGLNLALQIMEAAPRVVICVNLLDEARSRGLVPDLKLLEKRLGVPVVGTSASSGTGLSELTEEIMRAASGGAPDAFQVSYGDDIEAVLAKLVPEIRRLAPDSPVSARWIALRLLERDDSAISSTKSALNKDIESALAKPLADARGELLRRAITEQTLRDLIACEIVHAAEEITAGAVGHSGKGGACSRDLRIDKALTGRRLAFPVMFLALLLVFWITIFGANYPSKLLSEFLFGIENKLHFLLRAAPAWVDGGLISGVWRTLAWVVSVMLPPMAIFFPLFTLLEDLGYLPRVAYNLDRCFKCCRACGKQALTMCMGFGCNAVGVTGCRIIDSPRERLVAIITNNFVPCNGRFPMIISLISIFCVGIGGGFIRSALPALLLTCAIIFGVLMTLVISKLLSATLLKGQPSSFTMELPPYRKPQIGKVIVRSVLDRTLFVLGRAAVVAAPAGLLIWLSANVTIDGVTLLRRCSAFLDPLGRFLGMDGVILLAFILGLPANEIVVPIMVMAYTAQGGLTETANLAALRSLLTANGWTATTAVCVIIFSLMHWPCATTCMTIKKETGSVKWTLVSFAVPTLCGMTLCAAVSALSRLLI